MPCGSHLHNKNNNLPRVFSGSEAEPATKEKKRMMKHNYLTTNHFGGGNSVISGLTSVFHTSTKRRLLSCQRAIIAVFLRFLPLKAQDTSTHTSLMKPRKRPLSIPLLSATRVRASILTPAIANLSRSI